VKEPPTLVDEAPATSTESTGLVVVGQELQGADGSTIAISETPEVLDNVAAWVVTDEHREQAKAFEEERRRRTIRALYRSDDSQRRRAAQHERRRTR
jgi:hypothetical protein